MISFMTDGLGILTDSILSVKNLDLALLYTLAVSLYSYKFEPWEGSDDRILLSLVTLLFAFLFCSALFSYFHYGFSPVQIVRGGRHLFLFLSYFFLRKVSVDDVKWLFRALMVITAIHSILYIIQVLTGLPVLMYDLIAEVDPSTKILRYYNYPVLLPFFLFITVLFGINRNQRYIFLTFVLLGTLFLTLGRTYIFLTLFCLFMGFIINKEASQIIRASVILIIALLPFAGLIFDRFAGEDTDEDISVVLEGGFVDKVGGYSRGGTMEYRLAWVFERALYLSEQPLSENIFGLGMISDGQSEVVDAMYDFHIGLINDETGSIAQLYTPDIAFGNLLTSYGYVGGVILLLLWLRLLIVFFKQKRGDELLICMFLFLLHNILNSISSDTISNTANLVFPFLLLPLIYDGNGINKQIVLKDEDHTY